MRLALALAVGLMPVVPITVRAAEVGDVVSMSKGVSETVLAVSHPDRETVEMRTQALQANASEYCERYEQLTSGTPKWRKCVAENTSKIVSKIAVNCRTRTIILRDGPAAGSYRPSPGGGPWNSVANPNLIIVGDNVFQTACRRR